MKFGRKINIRDVPDPRDVPDKNIFMYPISGHSFLSL